jgi:hypothetical protein
MSDLSWLNPTPHAIAVYASRPLSPVATQHSLPSGRYSLLGPDFHRLDRTSLRLAHSFDHLVGEREQRRRDGETEYFGSLEIDSHLELYRGLRWKIGQPSKPATLFNNVVCAGEDRFRLATCTGLLTRAKPVSHHP